MFSSQRLSYALALCSICFLRFVSHVSAFEVVYCSNINTADTGKNTSIYQSNGLCSGFCNQDYAFAVVQDDGCWCSNYAPGSTAIGCNTKCPGYGFESCGGNGVYGYIKLNNAPSGTQGADQSSTTAQASTVTETIGPVTTTVNAPTSSPSSTSTSETSSSSTSTRRSTTSTPALTSESSETSSTWVPTPVISLETVTGQVRTVTVTPTVPPNSQNLNEISRKEGGGRSKGLGTGGAVGLTIGLVALVALVCGIIYFCLRKRKQKEAEEYNNVGRESMTGLKGPAPSRTMSENSRYVLGTDGRQVVETWENDNREAPGSRTSRLMPVDPRLDPFAPVYQRGENKSRESVNTIRDDHDYSRRVHVQGPILRATNPDD